MQQILFHIPFTGWISSSMPEGVPISGFGAMLFLVFVLTAMLWGPKRCMPIGLPRERLQDFAIVIFLTGIAGARIVYMIQYSNKFPDKSISGLVSAFFQIWNGGIVFYGSVIGGVLGFIVFYRLVLRKLQINIWKLADAVAPLIALGLVVGRMGCYLNGCCWGQPACSECQEVPLSASLGEFPLLTAHSRDQVVYPFDEKNEDHRLPFVHGLQTTAGFSIGSGDKRSVVVAVEPGSAAQAAGLRPGDQIIEVNGKPNQFVLELSNATEESLIQAVDAAKQAGGKPFGEIEHGKNYWLSRITFENETTLRAAMKATQTTGVSVVIRDLLWETVREWPQARKGKRTLSLVVDRGGEKIPIAFAPRTVAFYPTQVYEMVSMILLILVLLAFQPFRQHDGQLMVLLMLGYAAHRFLNEAIRIEPVYQFGLTLSQWMSIGIAAGAIALEIYLRRTQPKLS